MSKGIKDRIQTFFLVVLSLLFLFFWYDGLRYILNDKDISQTSLYIVSIASIFVAYISLSCFLLFAIVATIPIYSWSRHASFFDNVLWQMKDASWTTRFFRTLFFCLFIMYLIFSLQIVFDSVQALIIHKFAFAEAYVIKTGSTQGRKSPGHRYIQIENYSNNLILCSVCSAEIGEKVKITYLPASHFVLNVEHKNKFLPIIEQSN